MIYILLAGSFGLVILISILILILRLIEKRKIILISASILFAVGVLGWAYSALNY